jgi:hypothetical protein
MVFVRRAEMFWNAPGGGMVLAVVVATVVVVLGEAGGAGCRGG